MSPQTIYKNYGSKAAVLIRAIEVAVAGDYDEIPLTERVLAELGGDRSRPRFDAAAHFVRAMHDRVAALMRVMEQAASADPTLAELRAGLLRQIRTAIATWIAQIDPKVLRPGLSPDKATDVLFTVQSPYLYSMFTVDLSWSPDEYEEWLAHTLPRMLLRPELLDD